MSKENFKEENDRAFRIFFSIDSCHKTLTVVYEKLVDREFDAVKNDIRSIITELKTIIKSVDDDDF
jgi:hypothetical protein